MIEKCVKKYRIKLVKQKGGHGDGKIVEIIGSCSGIAV